jgi:hypothetical protein
MFFIVLSPRQLELINIIMYFIIILSLGLISVIVLLRRKNKPQNISNNEVNNTSQEVKISEERQLFISSLANAKFLASKGEYRKAITDGYIALRKDLSIVFMISPLMYMTEYEIIKSILEKSQISYLNINEIRNVLLKIYKLYEKARFSNNTITVDDYNMFIENIELLKRLFTRQVS